MLKIKSKDNLDKLVNQSRELRNEIGSWLLDFGRSFNLEHSQISYMIAAVDFQSDLFYAPVTNLSQEVLNEWLSCTSPLKALEVIDNLREGFPVGFSLDGFLRKLFENKTIPLDWPNLGVLYLDNDCKNIREVKKFSGGNIGQLDISIKGTISAAVADSINKGKNILKANATALLLQRREETFDNGFIKPSRSVKMLLAGVVFAKNINEIELSIKHLSCLANICAFASYAVFSERERYFERAIRQCHHGEMLKSGHFNEIKNQVKKLDILKEKGCWGLPPVIECDPELKKGGKKNYYSWFFMRRFLPPPLKELLTSVPGLADYEVRAIIHRTISHLRDSFWNIKAENEAENNERINVVRLPFYLAKMKAKNLSDHFKECMQRIRNLQPLNTRRGVILKTLSALGKVQEFSNRFIIDNWTIKAYFMKQGGDNEDILAPNNIATKFEELTKQYSNAVNDNVKKDNDIHGDAHFENILVDASIPEDPVVVSIDPYPNLNLSNKFREEYAQSCNITNDEVITKEIAWLFHDRTYDYAKLLLSAWLLYSVASVDGISMKRDKTEKNTWRFFLESDKIIKDNNIRGGATGAEIKTVTSIPHEVIRYHNIAKKAIIQSFLDELHRRYLNHNNDNDHEQINRLMVVRLWALTIRHGLSICSLIYPEKANSACSLYVITASLFSKGEKTVKKVLKEEYPSDAYELANELFAPRFQEKS